MDVDSCRDVLIEDCVFRAGDDGIAIKSGLDEAGRAFGVPSENIRIRNITVEPEFDNGSTNGVSIGSEMSGGVRNVTVDGLLVRSCAVGVYIKSREGRGGAVEDVAFLNVEAQRVLEPIRFAMDYSYRRRKSRRLDAAAAAAAAAAEGEGKGGAGGEEGGESDDDGDEGTPHFRNISVVNLTATDALVAGTFAGLPDSQITGIRLQDVTIHAADSEFRCKNASGTAVRTEPPPCFSER